MWFEKLHRHGPLPSSYLATYAGDVGENTIAKRLTLLSSEDNTLHGGRYLSRPPQQFATLDARYQQLVYASNERSERVLQERRCLRKHAPTISSRTWKHDHVAACVCASIELATKRESARYSYIIHDEVVDRLGRDHIEICGVRFVPDRWCGIRYLDQGGVILLAIEVDLGTEPLKPGGKWKSIARSFKQYHAWIKSGQYKRDLGTTGGIVVLTVTTSETRLENMIKLARRTIGLDRAPYFAFAHVDGIAPIYKPPHPLPDLFFGGLERVHGEPLCLAL
jgi:hypothetical protein